MPKSFRNSSYGFQNSAPKILNFSMAMDQARNHVKQEPTLMIEDDDYNGYNVVVPVNI